MMAVLSSLSRIYFLSRAVLPQLFCFQPFDVDVLSLFLQLRSRSSPVRSAGTSPREFTMESSLAKAAR